MLSIFIIPIQILTDRLLTILPGQNMYLWKNENSDLLKQSKISHRENLIFSKMAIPTIRTSTKKWPPLLSEEEPRGSCRKRGTFVEIVYTKSVEMQKNEKSSSICSNSRLFPPREWSEEPEGTCEVSISHISKNTKIMRSYLTQGQNQNNGYARQQGTPWGVLSCTGEFI